MKLTWTLIPIFVFLNFPVYAWWWSPTKKPPLSYGHSAEELQAMALKMQAAIGDHDAYFLENGILFHIDHASSPVPLTETSHFVRYVLLYAGTPVILEADGQVKVWLKCWNGPWFYEIAHSAIEIATDGVDLFTVTEAKHVEVFRGSVGNDVRWTCQASSRLASIFDGIPIFENVYTPLFAGQKVEFVDIGLPHALGLISENGRVYAEEENSKRFPLSR